jgi:pimeloyl-ACP methyl ester carboxylesterase
LTRIHVETLGHGPSVLLVHGSVTNAAATWSRQRPLAREFRLIVPDRPGFPPNPPVAAVDFAAEVPLVHELLGEGAHLVAHSYGGVIALLAAQARPDLVRSLTVIEPPALSVARGHPAVEAFVRAIEEHWRSGPREPLPFLRGFLRIVGAPWEHLSEPLRPDLEQGARTLMVERLPTEAELDLRALASARFPTLIVSGAHSPALDAVCDVLERELGAERAVIPGAGHAPQRVDDRFNPLLAAFLRRATTPAG